MSTLLHNQSAVSRTPEVLETGTGTVLLNTSEFLFYSNSPETLNTSDMADSGKFLNRVSVGGTGQIYTWHQNGCGMSIKNCILIYNPNTYAVKINVTNFGLTNTSNTGIPDAVAWESYYNGQNTTYTVAAGGYQNMFLSTIHSGYNFGIVARVNIVKSGTSTAATVTMFDLAYTSNSGGASAFAEADALTSKRARGKGAGFYATLSFPTVAPTAGTSCGYKIASTDSFFSGAECSNINDPSGITSGLLRGAYGQQLNITLPIKNVTGTARKFRVFIGSHGGNSFPFVNYAGGIAKYTSAAAYYSYRDVIETDSIANGATTSVQFSTVVTALASAPYFIGVYAV